MYNAYTERRNKETKTADCFAQVLIVFLYQDVYLTLHFVSIIMNVKIINSGSNIL